MWTQRENSLSELYAGKTQREKNIIIIKRNLGKIWHKENSKDPLEQVLERLNQAAGGKINSLEDLPDLVLEGLATSTIRYVYEFCEQVKGKTQNIIQKK